MKFTDQGVLLCFFLADGHHERRYNGSDPVYHGNCMFHLRWNQPVSRGAVFTYTRAEIEKSFLNELASVSITSAKVWCGEYSTIHTLFHLHDFGVMD